MAHIIFNDHILNVYLIIGIKCEWVTIRQCCSAISLLSTWTPPWRGVFYYKVAYFMYVLCLVTQSCPTLLPRGLEPTSHLCPWGFSRQEYWSGLPCHPPGDLLDPRIEPMTSGLLHWQAGSLPIVPTGKPILLTVLSNVSDNFPPFHSLPLVSHLYWFPFCWLPRF